MLDILPATSAPARTLAEFACGLTFEHIPAAVLERAKLLILDALGCGLPRTPTASRTPPWPAPPRSAGSAGAASSADPTACRSATPRSSMAC